MCTCAIFRYVCPFHHVCPTYNDSITDIPTVLAHTLHIFSVKLHGFINLT